MISPDKIVRSRRRTLSVSVDAFGRVIVRAPLQCPDAHIFAFLAQKEGWIRRQKDRAAQSSVILPPDCLEGYRFLLLGREHTLRLYEGTRIRYDERSAIVFLPAEKARERLVQWLKRNARRIFSAVASRRAAEMGTSYPSLTVTSAKTRWGSCSYNNALHFSFRLLYAPVAVIDYVVVHELAHTFHKDHSRAFWATVGRYVPDYPAKREWLKEKTLLMEIF